MELTLRSFILCASAPKSLLFQNLESQTVFDVNLIIFRMKDSVRVNFWIWRDEI